MSAKIRFFAFAAFVAGLSLTVLGAPPDARLNVVPGNLIPNGSFEIGTDIGTGSRVSFNSCTATPTGWTVDQPGHAWVSRITDSTAHPGYETTDPFGVYAIDTQWGFVISRSDVDIPAAGAYAFSFAWAVPTVGQRIVVTLSKAGFSKTLVDVTPGASDVACWHRERVDFELEEDGMYSIKVQVQDNKYQTSFDSLAIVPASDIELDPVPAVGYRGETAVPEVTVRDRSTGVVLGSDCYSVSCTENDGVGIGTVTVTGRNGYSGNSSAYFAVVPILRVTADADGTGDGSDWAKPMTLSAALESAAALGGELWLKGGTNTYAAALPSYTIYRPVFIRGGFDGDETSPEQRPPASFTALDGESAYLPLGFANIANVSFERLHFVRGVDSCLRRTAGAGDLVFNQCDFRDTQHLTGDNKTQGRGAYLSGKGIAFFSGCHFVNNGTSSEGASGAGGAIYASGLTRLVLSDCDLTGNGDTLGCGPGSRSTSVDGAAVFADKTPVTACRCSFRMNRSRFCFQYGNDGAVITLGGAAAPCAFSNCVFVANCSEGTVGNHRADALAVGTLVVNLADANTPIEIVDCTFAYNHCNAYRGPAGIQILKGKALIRGTVFSNQMRTSNASADPSNGLDVALWPTGAADIDYCLFNGDSTDYFSCQSGDESLLVLGTNNVFGSAKFATTPETVHGWMNKSGDFYMSYKAENAEQIRSINVHLLSSAGFIDSTGEWSKDTIEDSPAIDAGDPEREVGDEPTPNGNRRNIGAYGGTIEASKTPTATPEVPEENVVVTFPNGMTRPYVQVTMGGDGAYLATVRVMTSADGELWSATNVFTDVHRGDVLEELMDAFYDAGTDLRVRVEVSTKTVVMEPTVVQAKVTGGTPDYAGHGGPANVIHVMSNAVGRATGTSWADAVTNLSEAVTLLGEGRDEIWVAGTNWVHRPIAAKIVPACPAVIRGGFTAIEDDASGRSADAVTVIDGGHVFDPVVIGNTAAVTFERFHFIRGFESGFRKESGSGDLALVDCRFTDTTHGANTSPGNYGRGAYLTGGGTVTFTNCLFRNNAQGTDGNLGKGGGIFASGIGRLCLLDCAFVTNGVPFDYATGSWSTCLPGAAIYAENTPVTAVGCRFRGNRCRYSIQSGGAGSIVYLGGNSGGSAFTNCLFTGNSGYPVGQTRADPRGCGTLVVSLSSDAGTVDIDNCTFAYNYHNIQWGAAGVAVEKGAVRFRNSIFFGQVRGSNAYLNPTNALDISVWTGGSADVDYCLFESNSTDFVSACDGRPFTMGAHCVFGDPLLMTSRADALAMMNKSGNFYTGYKAAKCSEVTAMNMHLRGRTGYTDERSRTVVRSRINSPAIDKGDPGARCVEPKPNGLRVNLGVYGNTPWATMSPGGMLIYMK